MVETKNPQVNRKLTIDFNAVRTEKPIEMASLNLGIGRQILPWKTTNYRMPWNLIPEAHYRGLNFSFNLNMDAHIKDYQNSKKWQIPKVLLFLEKLKMDKIIYKYIIVYEYGKYGKKHGKIHYHGLVKTHKRDEFETEVLKTFNKRTQCSHNTLTTKHIKDPEHRATYLKYIKKEQHNKIKCLHWN